MRLCEWGWKKLYGCVSCELKGERKEMKSKDYLIKCYVGFDGKIFVFWCVRFIGCSFELYFFFDLFI